MGKKIIRGDVQGVKGAPGVGVIKADADGGMRKIRCPKCQGMAVPQTTPQGHSRLKCGACGAEFASRPM